MIRDLGVQNILKMKKASDLAKSYLQNFIASQIIFTLFNVGFFDECTKKGGFNPQSFAKKNQLDEKILCSLCDYLYLLKILNKKDGRYYLDSKGKLLVEMSRGLFDL